MKSLSRVRLLATPWTVAYQAPPSMGLSRQEYWSGVPLPSLHPRPRLQHFLQTAWMHLGCLLSLGSEGSVSTILKVCEHSLIPPPLPAQTPRQSRRVVGAGGHLLTPRGHHPESQLFCSLNGFALPGAPPPSNLSELETNSKRLCHHLVATTDLLAKAGKSGLLIPRTLGEEEELSREGGT